MCHPCYRSVPLIRSNYNRITDVSQENLARLQEDNMRMHNENRRVYEEHRLAQEEMRVSLTQMKDLLLGVLSSRSTGMPLFQYVINPVSYLLSSLYTVKLPTDAFIPIAYGVYGTCPTAFAC